VKAGVDVSRRLQQPGDVAQRMLVGADLAVELLAGCDHAGVTRTGHRQATRGTGTDDLAVRAGTIQREVGQGPRVDMTRAGDQTIMVADLRVNRRWPQWATRMRQELGVHAVLSLLLYTHDRSVGVLTLYSDRVDAFTPQDLALAQSLATHLAVAVADGQEIDRRGHAITDNTVVGQAEGILMQRYSIKAEEASDMLRRVSQDTDRTVAQIAHDFVHTRDLPVTTPDEPSNDAHE